MSNRAYTHVTIEPSRHWPEQPTVTWWQDSHRVRTDMPSSDAPPGPYFAGSRSLDTMLAHARNKGLHVVDTRKGEKWLDGVGVLDKDDNVISRTSTKRIRGAGPVTEMSRLLPHEMTTAGSVGGGMARPMVSNEPDDGDDDTWRQQNPQNVSGSRLAPTNGEPDSHPADEFYARYGLKNTTPAALHVALTQFAQARGMSGDQTRDLQSTLDRKYNMRTFQRVYT
mgnify:CR=1 FL=1